MTDFFDALETRDPAQREAALLAALPSPLKPQAPVPASVEMVPDEVILRTVELP